MVSTGEADVEDCETTAGLEGCVAAVTPDVVVAMDEMLLICIILPLNSRANALQVFLRQSGLLLYLNFFWLLHEGTHFICLALDSSASSKLLCRSAL